MKKDLQEEKSLLGIYCLLMIWIVLFNAALSAEELRVLVGNRSINLIPFYYGRDLAVQSGEMLRNVLVFLPFGLYLKVLEKPAGKAILVGFLVGLIFETCQFVLAVGASDVTDLIAYTLGTAAGVGCHSLFLKLFVDKERAAKAVNVMTTVAMVMFLAVTILRLDANRPG